MKKKAVQSLLWEPTISSNIKSRIAPTPSGLLHMGNAFNFVLTYALVKRRKGTLHLRIDDMDYQRTRKEYIEDIFRTIDWLDIEYDTGPFGVEDFLKNFSQTLKFDYYWSKIKDVPQIYGCECSRKELQKKGILSYPGLCRNKSLNFSENKNSLRIKVEESFSVSLNDKEINVYNNMGDFVVWRKDNVPSYQLVSVIDDTDLGINFIVRGMDLINSTAAQIYLAEQMKLSQFKSIQFSHHPLLRDENDLKLSKSRESESLANSTRPDELKRRIYQLVGKYLGLPYANDIKKVDELV